MLAAAANSWFMSQSFPAPPKMQTLALGADPSRFRVPQLPGQKWRLKQMYVYVKWNRTSG
jgi:hypothetical protein